MLEHKQIHSDIIGVYEIHLLPGTIQTYRYYHFMFEDVTIKDLGNNDEE